MSEKSIALSCAIERLVFERATKMGWTAETRVMLSTLFKNGDSSNIIPELLLIINSRQHVLSDAEEEQDLPDYVITFLKQDTDLGSLLSAYWVRLRLRCLVEEDILICSLSLEVSPRRIRKWVKDTISSRANADKVLKHLEASSVNRE